MQHCGFQDDEMTQAVVEGVYTNFEYLHIMEPSSYNSSALDNHGFSNESLLIYLQTINGTRLRSLPRAAVFPLGYRVVGTVVDIIIFIVGFLGNIMICAVVKKTKSLHTPTYCYLVRP